MFSLISTVFILAATVYWLRGNALEITPLLLAKLISHTMPQTPQTSDSPVIAGYALLLAIL